MSNQPDQVEKIYSRLKHQGNLRMWGQLYLSKTGKTVGGWLINSWAENGEPYWRNKMHWLDKEQNKLKKAQLGPDIGSMTLGEEDCDIEPGRAEFIRETIGQWEIEWLQEEAKKM